MRTRTLSAVLGILVTLLACNRDPNAAKQRYVQSGNKYFETGKYKQASIMYRKALSKDLRYGEAYYRLGLTELRLNNLPGAVKALRRAVELSPENEDAAAKLADVFMAAYLYDPSRPARYLDEIREIADPDRGLLKRNPQSFHGLRLMGFVALVEKDIPAALAHLKAANDVKPFEPDVTVPYIQALSSNNQWDQAEKLALTLMEKHPQFAPIYDLLYTEYMRRGRPADAEATLRKKADNNPKNVTYLMQLAAHYYNAKNEAEVARTLDRILANPTDFAKGRLWVGDFHARVKEFDKAIQKYEEGEKLASDARSKAEYRKHRVIAYVAQNRKKEALDLLDSVLEENSKDTEALALRASLSLQAGNGDQIQTAVNDLNTVISQQPQNFVVRYEAGRANLAKGDVQQARTQFQESVKIRPGYLPPRIALARLDLGQRDFAKALRGASEILALDPNDINAKLIRTSALIGSRDLKVARTELEQLVAARPDVAEAQFQLATLNFAEKRYREAEQIFRRMHEKNRDDPRGFMGLVECHMAQGRQADALAMLESVIAKSPERLDYHLALGNIAVRAGNYDLALKEYQRVLDKNPSSPDLYLRVGETYRLKRDLQSALKHFSKARELAPNDPASNMQLALLLDVTGQHDQARPLYEHVLKVDPNNHIALNNLAYMLAEKGTDLDQALTLAQRAKQKFPANPDIADTLGWIYIKKNLSDNAIAIFRDLTAKHQTVPLYHYRLGMALLQKGDKPEAKRALQTALKNNPSREEEGKIRELMDRIG